MEYVKLFDAEYRVMQIIWENEPLTSRELEVLPHNIYVPI